MSLSAPYAAYAFEVIVSKLNRKKALSLATFLHHLPTGSSLPTTAPLFVTWNVLHGRHEKELRGCIGTFADLDLNSGVEEYATISAFEDPRFEPISLEEVSELECAVTILIDFERINDIYNWVVGTHGIQISFSHKFRKYSGTFLPEVAQEQGWDQVETFQQLLRKAGFNSSRIVNDPDSWVEQLNLKVVKYKGLKQKISYSEYIAARAALG
ncbi:hypothetical protein BABINDRAFT_159826 [Babjeviella inositovora NRRL Y-12698]|uniref:AMMECR1 domain-containing protein n=1 Tax=Babjeviella inositovora NRRL Y-12698 TaxID=984486 RepID=A0A1E3QV61_9ASCO|nr:uncharacterized protein BABINDRAFT_159826 [Babjeviella inositovora NRRL Y-12698]ODQ81550.1 hypothetical protein BABINDRAFT_159826 [Babjeviella inositovora NRRL Y-12698]